MKIDAKDGGYSVTTEVYTARLDPNAVLTSLVIGGVEFIAPPAETRDQDGKKAPAPGLFACPTGQWYHRHAPPKFRTRRDNTLEAEGAGWKLAYTFQADAVELAFEGVPEGGRGFTSGYPSDDLAISLAHDLDRACDPENQGEFGWPVKRKHEPGNYVILAKNGAGLIAEGAARIQAIEDKNRILSAPHRLDLLVFNTAEKRSGPVRHRLRMFRTPSLAHSVTMEIQSPNQGHLFSQVDEVVFPVKVNVLYGRTFKGAVAFKGAPYVWKQPELVAEASAEVSGSSPFTTVALKIRPPKPGHYTGRVSISEEGKPAYSQRIGFVFQPERIAPVVPPADFDSFWDTTLAELDKTPLDMTLEERTDLESAVGRVYKVKYRSWGGRWAWAWLYVPKGEKKVAAQVVLPPVSVYQPPPPRLADGALRIMVAIHGGDVKDHPAKPDFDYMRTGITSRETYMMRYSYCCLVRCFDIIKQHEKCNGEIEVSGSSQGAGLSLVLTGLRNAKSAQGVAVALCRIDWTVLGYAEWGPRAPAGADPKQVAEVVRYYDPACFAHRIRTPLQLATGLFDFCAPAEGIFTAINALPKETRCKIFIDPYGGHFTLDLTGYGSGVGVVEVPRWQGTAAENKLGP
ncbi:MAG: acetylxylan esterase [Planctomycetia bacterium]|nr:acetylxylan esterase [Planctomycetia bacterium]